MNCMNESAAILAIKREVRRLDSENQDPENQDPENHETEITYMVATLLLSSLLVGTDVKRLSEFTGYSEAFVQDVSQKLEQAKIWQGATVNIEPWFEDHALPFWLTVYEGVEPEQIYDRDPGRRFDTSVKCGHNRAVSVPARLKVSQTL